MRRLLAEARAQGQQLLRPEACYQPAGEHTVPEMALIRRQVEPAQLRPEPSEGAPVVARILAQVRHQISRVSGLEFIAASLPVAPELCQDLFLALLLCPIEFIRRQQREAQRLLELSFDQ